MKSTALYILLLVCLFPASMVTAQQKEYKGRMNVTPLQLEQVGDSLRIGIDFDIRGVHVGTQRSISLIPVLIAPGKVAQLPQVMVKGRLNYLTSQRELALMSKTERRLYEQDSPYAIIKGYKSKEPKHIEYRKTIVFEPWMKDARLDIQEDLCGCGNRPRSLSNAPLVDQVKMELHEAPYTVTPYLAYIRPEGEAVKTRELVGEAFLDFVVSKIDIRPDYMNNPRELKKITDMVDEVRNDAAITVKGISVVGYASPEGTLKFNRYLSENRAAALVNYLLPRFDYPKQMYRIEFGGENWQGLRAAISNSDMSEKQELIAIIGNEKINRKAAIYAIKEGEVYRYILKKYCPALRKAICKIDYEVKGFDTTEAKEVFKIRPHNLSLNEMYLVANTYEIGSQEFIHVFETAVNLFPDDVTANINAASAALSRRDTAAAEQHLSKVKAKIRIPEYDNAVGVLEMLKGNYDKAEEFLRSAADAGLESAKLNLGELQKKRDNLNLFEKKTK